MGAGLLCLWNDYTETRVQCQRYEFSSVQNIKAKGKQYFSFEKSLPHCVTDSCLEYCVLSWMFFYSNVAPLANAVSYYWRYALCNHSSGNVFENTLIKIFVMQKNIIFFYCIFLVIFIGQYPIVCGFKRANHFCWVVKGYSCLEISVFSNVLYNRCHKCQMNTALNFAIW